jgi:AraC family transcriptional regulator
MPGEHQLRVLLLSDPAGVNDAPASHRAVVSMHVGASVETGCHRDGRYHRGLGVHGDIDIIPPGTPSRWELKTPDTALILAVPQTLLAMAAVDAGVDPAKLGIANRFQIRDLPMERIGWALKAEMEAGYPGGSTYLDGLAVDLAAALVERHSSRAGGVALYTYGMPGRTLRRVLGYIEDNLNRELSLKEIAGVAGLSVSHCKTAFSKSVGAPIHQYVIRRRVERAKQLLAKEGLSISEVAAAVGFTHKSHLAFHTRRVFGLSPTGLRRQVSGG